jgi:hypothetical protein
VKTRCAPQIGFTRIENAYISIFFVPPEDCLREIKAGFASAKMKKVLQKAGLW